MAPARRGAPDLECVANVSEGRAVEVLDRLAAACGDVLVDAHRDPGHHRAVLTLAGAGPEVEEAVRTLAVAAVEHLDLSGHEGSHPRLGVLDVVPFVPLEVPRRGRPFDPPADLGRALMARDRFAAWAGRTLGLPCFRYGPLPEGGERSLPDVRRTAFRELAPDTGPTAPHPTAGACAVGARGFLIAYNLWLADRPRLDTLAVARSVAVAMRGPAVRALGLDVGGRVQVSCNLVDPFAVGPADVYDRVSDLAEAAGGAIDSAELVGLVPVAVLDSVPRNRWGPLGLSRSATLEARLASPVA